MQEVILHMEMIGAAIFLAFIALYSAYLAGYFTLAERNHGTPGDSITWAPTLKIFALFFAFQFLLFPLIAYGALAIYTQSVDVKVQELSVEARGWMNLFAMGLLASVLFIYAFFNWAIIRPLFYAGHIVKDIALGMLTWVIAYPQIVLLSLLLTLLLSDFLGFNLVDQLAVRQIKGILEYPLLFSFTVVSVVTIIPLLEELLFRGFLQSTLRKTLPPLQAITLTSAIFALFHFSLSQGVNNFTILSSLFVLSLFLGFLRERQGTLWPSWALHTTFNALSIAMIFAEL